MNLPREQHLTDEQFADSFLDGVIPADVQAHLDTCELCRQELNGFTRSVDTFSEAALGWSESQPAFSPRSVTIGSLKIAVNARGLFTHAGWVLAAVLVLTVSVPAIWHREHETVARKNAAPLSVPDDSPQQIARDNDLMQSVNMALQTNDPSPFREYQITDVTGRNGKGHREVRSQ